MELTYDWRSFQSVFYPQKRALAPPPTASSARAVFAVVEKNHVVATYGDGDDFSEYIGFSLQAFQSALGGREVIALEREAIDQGLNGALALPHFHAQIEHVRKGLGKSIGPFDGQACLSDRHFVLDALLGNWAKTLPSAFGFFIRLEKAPAGHDISPVLFDALGSRCKEYLDREQDILILVRGRQLEAFYEPDLSSMGADRRHLCVDVVKYLSEKHSVPVQGLSIPYVDWIAWTYSNRPWRKFAKAVKSRHAKLYPLRWQVTGLLGLRAIFDY